MKQFSFKTSLVTMCLVFTQIAYAEIITKLDPFTGATSATSPLIELDNGCKGFLQCAVNTDRYSAYLDGYINREKTLISHCIVLRYYSDEWAFFDQAHDQTGTSIPVTVVDRKLGRPWSTSGVSETVCIKISRPYLEALVANGFKARLDGRNKRFIIELPGQFFSQYMTATADWPQSGSTLYRRIVLGIQYEAVTREKMPNLPSDVSRAYKVAAVAPFSFAESAGIRIGDIITKIDGEPVPEGDQLADMAQRWTQSNPGLLHVLRESEALDLVFRPK